MWFTLGLWDLSSQQTASDNKRDGGTTCQAVSDWQTTHVHAAGGVQSMYLKDQLMLLQC